MILRALEPEDLDLMFAADNDVEARKYSDYVAPLSRRLLMDYALTYDADPIRAGQLRMVAQLPDGKPVGLVDLYDISLRDNRASIGIYILQEYRNRGFAKEALKSAALYSSEALAISRLVAKIPASNNPSIRLFEKSGFCHVARLPQWKRVMGSLEDVLILVRES